MTRKKGYKDRNRRRVMTIATMVSKAACSDYGLAQLKEKVEYLQQEIERITMMTERKKLALKALRQAVDYCGYDIDALMTSKSRERTITDIRSIVWAIYHEETNYSCQQVAKDFGWDRTTVFCAIRRANEYRQVDRNFADMYDAIQGAFMNALSVNSENNSN